MDDEESEDVGEFGESNKVFDVDESSKSALFLDFKLLVQVRDPLVLRENPVVIETTNSRHRTT